LNSYQEYRIHMRIGINTLFLVPGDVGGTETYIRESLLAIAKHFPAVELVLFTNNENDRLLRDELREYKRIEFRCLNFDAGNRPLRILVEQTRLPWAVQHAALDVLWSPGYTAPFWRTCPQVVTIPDLQYKRHPEDMSGLERLTLNFLVQGACRRCDAVLAISEFSRQEIIRAGFAPETHVHAVLLGVDQSFGRHSSVAARNKMLESLVPCDVPYILCVAHTYPHKNVDLLIQAFGRIKDHIPHNLVLVGKPRRGEAAVARALCDSGSTSRLFRMSEGVPYQKLQMLFQGADIFVLPSSYEGFGLPVLEAMMAGVPVITSKEASLPEVGGDHVLYMKSMDVDGIIEPLLVITKKTSDELQALTAGAKKWAEGFTWEKSVRKMFSVFETVVTESKVKKYARLHS
jgi:glycosyltransferase involved in cell wall biosynthesis